MKRIICVLLASALALGSVAPVLAAGKKSAKSTYTEAQKKRMRREGLDWCRKKFIQGGAYIVRVEVLDGGGVRCWFKS